MPLDGQVLLSSVPTSSIRRNGNHARVSMISFIRAVAVYVIRSLISSRVLHVSVGAGMEGLLDHAHLACLLLTLHERR